jgi:hypothetical protein
VAERHLADDAGMGDVPVEREGGGGDVEPVAVLAARQPMVDGGVGGTAGNPAAVRVRLVDPLARDVERDGLSHRGTDQDAVDLDGSVIGAVLDEAEVDHVPALLCPLEAGIGTALVRGVVHGLGDADVHDRRAVVGGGCRRCCGLGRG